MTKLMNKKQEIKNRIDLINKGEVPAGYKNSWGYVYPEEWNLSTLNSLCSKVQKKNKENAQLQVLTNSATKGVILQEEYFDREIVNNENTDGYYIVEAGDFMYNPRISAAAPAGPINRNNLGISGIASPLYSIFRAKQTTNTNFIERYFESSFWHGYMKRVSNQGARHDRLNLLDEDFYKMPIPQPKVEEQEKIAEILSCCDKLIELKSELIQKKKKINISTINKVFNNIFYKKNLVKLSNLCSDFIVPMRDKPKTFDGSIPWCRIEDVEGNFLNGTKSNKYVSEDTVKKMNLKIIPSGSVICACSASIGTYVINTTPLITNQTFIGLVCSEKIYNKYLLYFLKTQTNNLMRKSNGTTIGYISREQFERMDIPYVPMQEQMHIANVFFQADKEIELLEQELEQYKQLKKSLSQLLLTGIVRVNEV